MAYKPKAPPVMAAPNVIPMADIMLVLLIIFMVITPMLHKGVQVNMAAARNVDSMQPADRDDAIIVAVTRDGKTYLGNNEVSSNEITDQVKDLIANRLDKTVYVRSDARAKYGDVVERGGRGPGGRSRKPRPPHRQVGIEQDGAAASA